MLELLIDVPRGSILGFGDDFSFCVSDRPGQLVTVQRILHLLLSIQHEYREHQEYEPARDHRHVLFRVFALAEDVTRSSKAVVEASNECSRDKPAAAKYTAHSEEPDGQVGES